MFNMYVCNMNNFLRLLAFIVVMSCVQSLYEDQIKKFDWRSLQIGGLRQVHLDLNGLESRLLVTTYENVLARLCPKTGELIWRQVLETGPRGNIKLMQVGTVPRGNGNEAAVSVSGSNYNFDMLTVQGYSPALIRGWNTNTGHIEWEWSLMPLQRNDSEKTFWFYSNLMLYHIVCVWFKHLEVTRYYASTGQAVSSTSKISAVWINEEKCILSGKYFACLEKEFLFSIDLTATEPKVFSQSLHKTPVQSIKTLEEVNGVVIIDNTLVGVKKEIHTCGALFGQSYVIGYFKNERVIATAILMNNVLHIEGFNWNTCVSIRELRQNFTYPDHYGVPTLKSMDCKINRLNDGNNCLFIFATTDDSILAVQKSKLRWTRSEALANIVAAEFIDLPLIDSEGTLENEMKSKTGNIFDAFTHRLITQAIHMKNLFLHLMDFRAKPTTNQRIDLVRDSFGLHKMLVVLTKCGKLFGLDNINGKEYWQRFLPNIESFGFGEEMRLFVQRTNKFFPLQAICTVVAKDKVSGNGVLFRFNPITGQSVENGILLLDYKIKQMGLLPEMADNHIKGLLILDDSDSLHVYPPNVIHKANDIYFFTANKDLATLQGFNVQYINQELTTLNLWNVDLSGSTGDHKIVALSAKNPNEHVHSQGRVMPDRSVLYKYINPNLVAVFTQAPDDIHKFLLYMYLIDVVSGSVVFTMLHRKVKLPLHVVHSENWLVYTYYNDKVRRTEITTIELYEGIAQTNSTDWNSLNAPSPLVERQSYIMPTAVETMRETITERGITNKNVLFGTYKGAIVAMPWSFLDPRRSISTSSNVREEGSMPYIPELPIPTEAIINYNQTIERLRYIYTAPSGLESTCLVLAGGLDIFVTRVAPSKSYDLLKEDFDYFLITVVLVILISGSFITKYLAARKQLKQAWK